MLVFEGLKEHISSDALKFYIGQVFHNGLHCPRKGTVKPFYSGNYLNRHVADCCLMQDKSNAESSCRGLMHYFKPVLSSHFS